MPTEMMIQTTATTASTLHNVTPQVGAVAAQSAANGTTVQKQSAAQQSRPNRDEVKAAAAEITKIVQNVQRNLNFSVDEDSGETVVKVIDAQSDEVIRQIPSEEMLALARRLRELEGDNTSSGLLVRSKA